MKNFYYWLMVKKIINIPLIELVAIIIVVIIYSSIFWLIINQ